MAVLPIPSAEKILDGITFKFKSNSLQASFGHNYSQIADDGIDSLSYSTAITLAKLTLAELNTVKAFLLDAGSANPFLIELPDEPDLIVRMAQGSMKITSTDTNTFKLQIGVVQHKFPGVAP